MVHRRSRDLLIIGTALLVVVADQLTKAWVRRNLLLGVSWDPIPWLRPILSFTYITNTGAAFGMFPQLGPLFAVIAVAVIAVLFFLFRGLAVSGWPITLGLGMILGGALGNNVIDRVLRGRVTDFIDLNFWPMQEWPVFNVADSSITVGTCILSICLLLQKEPPATAASPASDADAPTKP